LVRVDKRAFPGEDERPSDTPRSSLVPAFGAVMSTRRTFVWILCCLFLGTGCAFQAAMSRGEEAMQARDYERAVREYSEATRLDPADRDARNALERARTGAVSARLDTARAALMAGQLVDAAHDVGEAERLLPGDQQVAVLADEVLAAVVKAVHVHILARQHLMALTLIDEVRGSLPDREGRLPSEESRTRAMWITSLTEDRDGAIKLGRIGDALLQERQLIELQPSAVERAKCGQLKTQLRQKYEVVLEQAPIADEGRGRRSGPGMRLVEIGRRLAQVGESQWLRVVSPDESGKGKGLVLGYSVSEPRIGTDREVREGRGEYQAGTRQVLNPRRLDLEARMSELNDTTNKNERDARAADEDVRQAMDAVDREGPTPDVVTPAEQRLDDARARREAVRVHMNEVRRLSQATRDDLMREPPFLLEPVMRGLSYDIELRTVRAMSLLTTTLGLRNKPSTPLTRPIEVGASDTSWAPQPLLSLPGDPSILPSDHELMDMLVDALTAALGAQIQSAFSRAVTEQRARAMALDGDARVEQLVVYLAMDPAVADPEVDALLWEVRGIPASATLLDTCGTP